MSPSEPAPDQPPPEVLAIAVALAALWPRAVVAAAYGADGTPAASPWRWAGRQWQRPATHKWS